MPTITETIPLVKGILERKIVMSMNTSKIFPGHTVMEERVFIYNLPEGQLTVTENATYVLGLPPGPASPPVITAVYDEDEATK